MLRYGAHVRANGIRQHYLRYAIEGQSQQPLVLVPGIVSPAAIWGFVGERLGRTFDTYVLDVRGRGLSEGGPDLDYGLDACAADLRAFAEASGDWSTWTVDKSSKFVVKLSTCCTPTNPSGPCAGASRVSVS